MKKGLVMMTFVNPYPVKYIEILASLSPRFAVDCLDTV